MGSQICKQIKVKIKKLTSKMQALRSSFLSISSKFLFPRSNIQLIEANRSYVRSFWVENNDYKGIPGNVRNPPKHGGHTLNSTRKIKREVHRPSEIKRLRSKGFDALMTTPSGRITIMKKYLEKSPFLAEC